MIDGKRFISLDEAIRYYKACYPECCSNDYNIDNVYTYEEEETTE